MKDIADKLDEARKLIERGWGQGDYVTCDGVCAMGAINAAFTGDPEDHPMSYSAEAAREFLRDAIGDFSIVAFNDFPGRTQTEVVEAFRKAAELAREQVSA